MRRLLSARVMSMSAALFKRRPMLKLLKLSSALVAVSFVAVLYGQHVLRSGGAGYNAAVEPERKIEIVLSQQSAVASNAGAPGLSPAAAAALVIANHEVMAPRRKSSDFERGNTPTGTPEYSVRFYDTRKPSEQSLELQDWVRKMETTASMVRDDAEELGDDPKEFLFPCAQDHYTLSDSIREDPVTGMISGSGEVKFGGDSLCTTSFEIRKAKGNFVEGKLEGEGVITFLDGSLLKGTFHKGVLHGLSRKFWCRFGPCDLFEKREWTVPKYLWEVAWFKDGVRTGVAWEFRAGGGAVVGAVDLGGALSGDHVVYVYPDMWTMLAGGSFDDGQLVRGYESRLERIEMDDENLLMARPVPMPPKMSHVPHRFEQSNATHLTASEGSRHLRDPYEEQYVEVRKSSLLKANRGLFLKRPVKAGTVVSFYNGARRTSGESTLRRADRFSSYRIDNEWAVPDQILEIPEMLREPYEYNATLGHFANSAPDRANAWHAMIDHPRFGAIRCLITLKDLKSGAELFVDDTDIFEETGPRKGSSGGGVEGDPLMNMISGVGKAFTGKGKGGGGVMDLVNLGMNAMGAGGGGGGKDGSVGGKSPMMDIVSMGINAMAGGGNKGGNKGGSGGGGGGSPVADLVKMGVNAMAGGGGGRGGSNGGGGGSQVMDLVNMGANLMGAVGGSGGGGRNGGGSPVMDIVKMGANVLGGGGGSKDDSGDGSNAMMNVLKMGKSFSDMMNAKGGGGSGGGGSGDNNLKPYMDVVKMGMKMMQQNRRRRR